MLDAQVLGNFLLECENVWAMNELAGADDVLDGSRQFTTDEYYGIGLKKDDQEGTDAINAALERMYADGTFQRLLTENLGEDSVVVEEGTPGDLSFLDAS